MTTLTIPAHNTERETRAADQCLARYIGERRAEITEELMALETRRQELEDELVLLSNIRE